MVNSNLLRVDRIPITDQITIMIPTVGEVLDHERYYYSMAYTLTSTPYQQMVQLDDAGIDYTKISEYELFIRNMISYAYSKKEIALQVKGLEESGAKENATQIEELQKKMEFVDVPVRLIFGDDFEIGAYDLYKDKEIDELILFNPVTGARIDRLTYLAISETIRKINSFEHVKLKPGNESARTYLLEKERKRLKRAARKPFVSQLEQRVVGLVNTAEFPYNYESCMDLSLYKFNKSFEQIRHRITYDEVMMGVYSGTVNTKDISDKSILSWIKLN